MILRKGATITPEIAASLAAAGLERIVAVRLEEGDVGEDEAALSLARSSAGPRVRVERPFTGRSNLYATESGLLIVDRPAVDRLNAVDETITLATLPAFKPVVAGEMVATVKIIPYAVRVEALDRAAAALGTGGTAIEIAPYRLRRVGAISTLTPGLKPSIVTKTIAVLNARLAPAGGSVVTDAACPHDTGALATELGRQAAGEPELIVVFGASAIADRRDVIPAAIEAAGGRVEHLGMPVDPGNLLLIGEIAGKPVIGAPGCARSPKENGFDWVLQRLLAGLPVTRADITGMGVGGLLMEIVSRGQPRDGGEPGEDE
jgi:molybdenum cofactor cytidylyltransferase